MNELDGMGTPESLLDENGQPKRTVLIVDDSAMFRDIETVFLRRSANVMTAVDGCDALELAHEARPDIVVTDLTMQQMHGDELCRRMREDVDLKRIPVVVVTSGISGEERERAVRAGADDVLEKPVNRITLLQAVNRLMRQMVRGLVRVPLATDVRLVLAGQERWGLARNISRGGIYVEVDEADAPDTELQLEFHMPELPQSLQPTARVVWRAPARHGGLAGMGLQFLKLEHDAAEWLANYVYELASPEHLEEIAAPR